MRFILSPEYHEQMLSLPDHPADCYVRPGEYLHHLYVEGVKYVIVPALLECLSEAEKRRDEDALRHLNLHRVQLEALTAEALQNGGLEGVVLLGDPPPEDDGTAGTTASGYAPQIPRSLKDTGLNITFLFDLILRTIYNAGRITGGELAGMMKLPYSVVAPILPAMRKQGLIDIVGQRGDAGDAGYEYEIKPPKGPLAVEEALNKTTYVGPAPVPFEDYVECIAAQTIRNFVCTRRTIEAAFRDMIITPEVFNEIGPAINSAASIFLFGAPGNGKTSIAERITRLMGDDIYIPYAIEANGQIIKLFDPIVHQASQENRSHSHQGVEGIFRREVIADERYVKIRRPTIVVGGELSMDMLDLKYHEVGKFYEAPLQMKANGGIFMIDDFGRQQMRPMDLLNRWIVPLEKKYDYLTTVTGTKIEVPFDQLLIFSTNLDPTQLADEAFLRRIKFKIEIRDPSETQWRQIWQLVCRSRNVEYDESGVDYILEKWMRPQQRPLRMCQPRDILDQMISIAKYNMERVTFSPDLIDAACATYFVSNQKRDFGAKVTGS
ncbi:MAG: ATP-binding protein [Gemmataceae bacterium]|nr:ATP-binding protein [Gemmataceae bacterium]